MLKIGIIGVGVVGSSVVKILTESAELISARAGKELVVTKGVVKNLNKKRDLNIPLSDDVNFVLDDPEIDIVVELMGGVEEAYLVVKKALSQDKAVVSANKALLAYHRYELEKEAESRELQFEYEASVAGGIPIIKALRDGLSANEIVSIKGIINGTSNYILTQMSEYGRDFSEVLKEAQNLGYAEADPTFDIGGFDAAHKLLILASIAYGIDCKPEDILIEGIENINLDDIEFAKEYGYKLKLLAIAKKVDSGVELRVHPTYIPQNEMIAKVDGVMNGISVVGNYVGETMYYGAGAGGDATASAVISDLVEIARDGKVSPMLGFQNRPKELITLSQKENIISKYYIRISVEDRAGVLAGIAKILGELNISIETLYQRNSKDKATLLLSTHLSQELSIQKALNEIEKLSYVKDKPFMIRIEESE